MLLNKHIEVSIRSEIEDLRDFAEFYYFYCTAILQHYQSILVRRSNAAAWPVYTLIVKYDANAAALSVYQYIWNLTPGKFPRLPDGVKHMVEYPCFNFFCWRPLLSLLKSKPHYSSDFTDFKVECFGNLKWHFPGLWKYLGIDLFWTSMEGLKMLWMHKAVETEIFCCCPSSRKTLEILKFKTSKN